MTQAYVLVVQFHSRQLLEEEEEKTIQENCLIHNRVLMEHKIIIQWKRTLRMCALKIEATQDTDTRTHTRIPGINTLHQTHHWTVSNKVLLLFLINVLWRRTWNAFLQTLFIWFQWQTATIFAILHTFTTFFIRSPTLLYSSHYALAIMFHFCLSLSLLSISLIVISHATKKKRNMKRMQAKCSSSNAGNAESFFPWIVTVCFDGVHVFLALFETWNKRNGNWMSQTEMAMTQVNRKYCLGLALPFSMHISLFHYKQHITHAYTHTCPKWIQVQHI